jgi:hypothetical protein
MQRAWLVVATVVLLAACTATPSKTAVNESLARDPGQLPRRILLLPAEIRVHEMSAGGVTEKVDAWSTTASEHAGKYVRTQADDRGLFELVESPPLAAEQKHLLEQHIALYDQVAGSAYFARSSVFPAWRERAKTFDYTLGPGLKAFADQTGIDAAMIVSGSDYISTAGRKAAMVMGVLVGAALGVAVVPQGGISFVSVGVIDLRSGNLIWFGTDRSESADLRNEPDVQRMLDGLFKTYPGAAAANAS